MIKVTSGVLVVIPARAGSKRLPRKNIKELGGIPLLAYRIRSALHSTCVSRVIVSTDDDDIARLSEKFGAEVLFKRPAELASDVARSSEVLTHSLNWIEEHEHQTYEAVLLAEPTTPFVRVEHIDQAYVTLRKKKASLILGVTEAHFPSVFMGPLTKDGCASRIISKFQSLKDRRTQAVDKEYAINGGIYLLDWGCFKNTGEIYAEPDRAYTTVMDTFHSVNIDSEVDFRIAQAFIDAGVVDLKHWQSII